MKILHLEDSPQDAELVEAIVSEEWPDCQIAVVENREAFLAQLARPHDIILSDFTLGSFDGMEALKLARATAPQIPFIFVSGSIGEERAVEAVRMGAHDYVIKDRMRRLNTSIQRALNVRRDRQRRHAAEAAHRRLVSILESTPDLVGLMTPQGQFTYLNRAGCRMLATDELAAQTLTLSELYAPDMPASVMQAAVPAAVSAGFWAGETILQARDGRRFPASQTLLAHRQPDGAVEYLSIIVRDLTEKKHMEEQVQRAQRVETIGMLAAGIAHDLNNVLAPISMGAPIVQARSTDPAVIKLASAMASSAQRGMALVRQILAFARGSGGEHVPVQLAHLARDICVMIEETFPQQIKLDCELPSDLWLIEGNPTQLHQVLLNLCVNARDAMPQGGTLKLVFSNRLLDAPVENDRPRPGRTVVIEISDTGTGIPPDVLARMWEPFFTTKSSAHGTGLGLSTVRGIVETHHGAVKVASRMGQGSSFTVYFPAAAD